MECFSIFTEAIRSILLSLISTCISADDLQEKQKVNILFLQSSGDSYGLKIEMMTPPSGFTKTVCLISFPV